MKIALVTGANRGIGFETSKILAQNGFKVYMGCRDEAKGELAVDILLKQKLNVVVVKLDVNKTKDIRGVHNLLRDNGEIPDVVVNNAGVFLESDGPKDKEGSSIFSVDPVIILKTIETNAMGPLKLAQALVPMMMEKNEGRVINISSGMGQLNGMNGHWPGYRMSKTALNAFTRILSDEVSHTNLSINSVCPGWVQTDMGGKDANLTTAEAVKSIIWLATCDNPPKGQFIRDQKQIDW